MTDVGPRSLANFVRSIAVLALPAKAQVEWLDSLGLGKAGLADEIMLELNDGVLLMDQFADAGWVGGALTAAVRDLENLLAPHDGRDDDGFWDVESLAAHDDWARARVLARAALNAI